MSETTELTEYEREYWWASFDGDPAEPVEVIRNGYGELYGVHVICSDQIWLPEEVRLIARLHAPPPDLMPATGDPRGV